MNFGASPTVIIEVDAIKSKSNFRRGTSSSWAKQKGFEDTVGLLARAARPSDWDLGNPDDKVTDRPVVVAVIAAVTMLDAGNLSKSILDAVEGVLYVTDASVAAVSEVRRRSRTNQRGVVGFLQLQPEAPTHEIAEAIAYLTDKVLEVANLDN